MDTSESAFHVGKTDHGKKGFPLKKKKQGHSHTIAFVRYGDTPGHIHGYSTHTSIDDRHRHLVQGRTSPPYPRMGGAHVHYYEGVTSFNDGHVHSFRSWTGPPIPLPGGGHYHEFWGETTFDDGHTHRYSGRTGADFM